MSSEEYYSIESDSEYSSTEATWGNPYFADAWGEQSKTFWEDYFGCTKSDATSAAENIRDLIISQAMKNAKKEEAKKWKAFEAEVKKANDEAIGWYFNHATGGDTETELLTLIEEEVVNTLLRNQDITIFNLIDASTPKGLNKYGMESFINKNVAELVSAFKEKDLQEIFNQHEQGNINV